MAYLKSSDPTFDRAELKDIFGALHGEEAADGVDCYFEHGQWWVYCCGSGKVYSVVDASGDPSVVCDGLSFEEIG
jgi:hypothetical protein